MDDMQKAIYPQRLPCGELDMGLSLFLPVSAGNSFKLHARTEVLMLLGFQTEKYPDNIELKQTRPADYKPTDPDHKLSAARVN